MVKISTVLAVFASYAMQFYVPIPILMPILTKKLSCIGSDFIIEYGYRTIMVLVICKLFHTYYIVFVFNLIFFFFGF